MITSMLKSLIKFVFIVAMVIYFILMTVSMVIVFEKSLEANQMVKGIDAYLQKQDSNYDAFIKQWEIEHTQAETPKSLETPSFQAITQSTETKEV